MGTAKFGQADLSKTETHTEAPMTQLGRAAASSSIIEHVWFVKKLSEPEFRPSFLICVSPNTFVAKPFRAAAAIGSIVDPIYLVSSYFLFPTVFCVEENMKDDRQRTI